MTDLAKYFGGLQLGQTIPAFVPNDARLLPCDGVSEAPVNNNNAFLGNIYPRLTQAASRQYSAATHPSFVPLDVAYGNGMYVAVGNTTNSATVNYVYTSADGKTWVPREIPVTCMWRSVIWTGLYFLMFGYDPSNTGYILRSDDGMIWTQHLSGGYDWSAIHTLDNYTVATLNNGQCVTSPDGINWTSQNPNFVMTKMRAFKGQLYGVRSGAIYKSDNGINWSLLMNITGVFDIETNGTTIVAVSSSVNQTRYSTDGTTWNVVTVGGFRLNVVWNGENYVCFTSTGTDTYRTSPDGITWTQRTWQTAAYSMFTKLVVPNLTTGEVFCIYASGITHIPLITKTWGLDFASVALSSIEIRGILHTGSRYIAYGRSTTNSAPFISMSTDGVTWVTREIPGVNSLYLTDHGINGDTIILAANGSTQYVMSTDGGLSWVVRNHPVGIHKVVWNGTLWAAFYNGSTIYATSADGINWTNRSMGGSLFRGAAVNGTTIGVSTGDGSTALYRYSTDGINWTNGASYGSPAYEVFAFKTYFFVLVQSSANILRFTTTFGGLTNVALGASMTTQTQKAMVSPNAMVVYSDNLGVYGTTTDGVTFTARTFQNANQIWGPGTWNGQLNEWYISGTTNRKATRSTDMIKWSFLSPEFGSAFVHSFTSVTRHGTKMVSQSGIKNDNELFWRPIVIPQHGVLSSLINGLVFSNGTGIVSAFAQSDGANMNISTAYSENGLEWTLSDVLYQTPVAQSVPSPRVTQIHHDGTYWYIFTNCLFCLRSPDGKVWTKVNLPFSTLHQYQVASGNGKLVALPNKGYLSGSNPVSTGDSSFYYVSSDGGLNWTRYVCPFVNALFLTYGALKGFMMLNYGNTEYRFSTDGITWSDAMNLRSGANASPGVCTALRYIDGMYVLTANTSVVFTMDGITWNSRSPSVQGSGLNVTPAYVGVDGVLNLESNSAVGNSLTTTYLKANPKVIRAPFITPSTPPANSYSMVVG